MWQTKYALAVLKNLGVGVNFRPSSEDYFLLGVRSRWTTLFQHTWAMNKGINQDHISGGRLYFNLARPSVKSTL